MSFKELKIYREFLQEYQLKLSKLNNLKDLFSNLHVTIGDISDVVEKLNNIKSIVDLKPIDTSKLNSLKNIKEMINNIRIKKEGIQVKPHVPWNYSKEDYDKLLSLKAYAKNHSDIEHKQVELSTSMIAYKKSIETIEFIEMGGGSKSRPPIFSAEKGRGKREEGRTKKPPFLCFSEGGRR